MATLERREAIVVLRAATGWSSKKRSMTATSVCAENFTYLPLFLLKSIAPYLVGNSRERAPTESTHADERWCKK